MNDLAALQALTGGDYNAVWMLGRTDPDDDGGGLFYWTAEDVSDLVDKDAAHGLVVPPSGEDGSLGAHIRRYPKNILRPEWFGKTFTHVELQRAASYLDNHNAIVLTPGSHYQCSEEVFFDATRGRVVCLTGNVEGHPRIQAMETGMRLFRFRAWGARVSGLAFVGTDAEMAAIPTAYGTSYGLHFDQTDWLGAAEDDSGANIDAAITNCSFNGLRTGVFGRGRNVELVGNIFGACQYGIEGAIFLFDTGTKKAQFRGWIVAGNRFHGVGTPKVLRAPDMAAVPTYCIQFPIDSSEAPLGGIVCQGNSVLNNHADTCADFYAGTLHNTLILGNHFLTACGPMVTCHGSDWNANAYVNAGGVSRIADNVWQGTAAPAQGYYHQPEYWVDVDNVANLAIRNNGAALTTKSLLVYQNPYNSSVCDNDLLYANVAYAREGVGDHPAVKIGSNASYDDHILTWVNNNKVGGGYHDYAIYINGREEMISLGINQFTPGRTGTIGSASGTTHGMPSSITIDASWGDSGTHYGDVVIQPYMWYGKPTGRRTRIDGHLDISGDKLRVRTAKTPTGPTAAGAAGEWCWDGGYLYICVATDTWKRVAISDSGWT